MACGSRAGIRAYEGEDPLQQSRAGDEGARSAGGVEFPSLEETIGVPPPSLGPEGQFQRAPDPPRGECELAAPSLDVLLARIEADVLAQPAADRRFSRYLGTGSLFIGYCDVGSALDATADALPLLLNSLSISESPARARVIDREAGLLRIDLRELRWERPLRIAGQEYADGWQALAAHAPEALALRGSEADALFEQLGTRTALLQAQDWMHAALSADVYYALLDAPESVAELQTQLGIAPELAREPNADWRAVTTASRVSRQDRLVLRYRGPSSGRLFWRTIDQLPETAYGGPFVDPFTREGDESAIVYTLPNGLPAYFLADAGGRRLNESRVLLDTSENDFVPHTAPSCLRCHSQTGVVPVKDELRPYAATDPNGRFDARQRALIAEVYPEQAELDALFEADTRRIEDAQARAGVPRAASFGQDLSAEYARDLRPDVAAAELLVSSSELRERRGELPGALRVLLGIGSVGRAGFNEAYREALCVLSRDWRNQPSDCP